MSVSKNAEIINAAVTIVKESKYGQSESGQPPLTVAAIQYLQKLFEAAKNGDV